MRPGANFDLFIKLKNHFPEDLRRYIRQARLFSFDLFPTETLDGLKMEEMGDVAYNFCLPFPVVAVEDKVSCVIVWDIKKGVVGIEHTRGIMEVSNLKNYLDGRAYKVSSQDKLQGITEEVDQEARDGLKKSFGDGPYPDAVRFGVVNIQWISDVQKWGGTATVGGGVFLFPSGEVLDLVKEPSLLGGTEALEKDFTRGAITAYEELLRMSAIRTFIIEKSPKKVRTNHTYLRSFERPIYTVVTPLAARRIMQLPEPREEKDEQGRTIFERRAHIRREHERTLHSEKFTHRRGQTLTVKRAYIPAVWRGESSADVGKHHYRVILDLPTNLLEGIEP